MIFISIDDNEVHHLRKVCDEVFGEENFVETLIWKRRATPPNDRIIGRNHEYIMVYSKNIELMKLFLQPRSENINKAYKNPNNDPNGSWTASDLSANGKGGRLVDSCIFSIKDTKTGKEFMPPENKCWLYNEEKVKKLISEGRIGFRKTTGTPFLKRYLSEVRQGSTLATIIEDGGFSQNSAKEIRVLFDSDAFEFPKPITLLEKLIVAGIDKNDIILDFFAGSGTTAHAVMKLNAEDNGNRKFILVQLPELTNEKSEAYKAGYKKISDITIERNKRVIEKERYQAGFKVYKLDKSNFPRVDFQSNPEFDEKQNIELLKSYIKEKESAFKTLFNKEMIFDEVLLKNGFMLDYKLTRIEIFTKNSVYHAKDNNKKAIICLDDKLHEESLKTLHEHKDELFICIEQAIDTTVKWNLKELFGEKLVTF